MRGLARMRWVAVAAAIAMVATACGGDDDDDDDAAASPSPPEAAAGGTFAVDIGEPEFLVPGNTNESEGGTVLRQVYTGLFDYDEDVNLIPVIAAGMPETTDNITWTISINPGWTFHNGEEVTARHFVQAWNTTAYGPNAFGNSYFMDRIAGYGDLQSVDPDGPEGPEEAPPPAAIEMSGLRAVDDTTIEVTLTAPFSSFPLLLGYTAFYPLADACVADLEVCNEAPIGNGPYEVTSWEHNVLITLTKYADYAGTPGSADEILLKIYEDENVRIADFEAGELDILRAPPTARIPGLRTELGDRFIEVPTSSFTYVGFPLYDERFENPLLRQAFSLAIDRAAIIDNIFEGRFQPADNIVSPVVSGYVAGACEFCTYDPARAQELFGQAGGFDGTLELWFNAGVGHELWMQVVGDQIRETLGVDYELRGDLQFAEYLGVADAGVDADAETDGFTGPFRLGWIMDYPSPENYLKPLHGSQGTSNNTGYSNADADALIAEGDAAATLDEGVASYVAAADLILADVPVIPMWFGRSSVGYAETVDNVTVNPFSILDLTKVTVVDAG